MRKKTALQNPRNPEASPDQPLGLIAKGQQPGESAQEKCALLRNPSCCWSWNEGEAKGRSLGEEAAGFSLLVELIVVVKDRFIVGLAGGDEVVDDASELVGGGGDGLRCAEAVARAAVKLAEVGRVAVKGLGGHTQGSSGPVIDLAGFGREDLSATDAIVGTQAEPTGELASVGKGGKVTAFGEEGSDGGDLEAGDGREIGSKDAVELGP